jgi:hypothetical protein
MGRSQTLPGRARQNVAISCFRSNKLDGQILFKDCIIINPQHTTSLQRQQKMNVLLLQHAEAVNQDDRLKTKNR